jgi:hypothetical protein
MPQSNTAARTFGPGVFKRLPYAVYDGIPATNSSKLRELLRSPKQYHYRLDVPREGEALTIGQATHTAILEPHRFLAEYALWDERSEGGRVRPRNGKDWEKFKATHEGQGKRILLAEDFNLAIAMRDAVRNHGPALRYLRKGDPEISLVWDDLETHRRCKGRVDWVADDAGVPVLVGVKTARECGPRAFGNAAFKYGYHLQWAYYFDGFFTATGVSPRMVEIVVEKEPPHDVAVYVIPPELIELGRDEYRRLLVKLAECEHTHDWPGAVPGEEVLSFPAYAFGDDDVSGLELEVGQ